VSLGKAVMGEGNRTSFIRLAQLGCQGDGRHRTVALNRAKRLARLMGSQNQSVDGISEPRDSVVM
jgi:hypothetical protein